MKKPKCINTGRCIPQRTKDRLKLLSDDIITRRTYKDGEKTYSTIEIKESDLIEKIDYLLGI